MSTDHFSDRSAAYARCRPDYPAALVDWLAALTPARDLAWDAGCGSGQFSSMLADRFARVIATDASEAQLTHARPHARILYGRAAAEACPLRDGSIVLATAAQAAHWFDLPRYWAEVRRVVRPRGVVAVACYGLATVSSRIDERVLRFYREEAGPYWPPERRLVEDGYRSMPFPFEEIEPPRFVMSQSWTADEFAGYVATWSAVRGLESDGGAERFAAFARELHALWGSGARVVRWPLAMRVGRARA